MSLPKSVSKTITCVDIEGNEYKVSTNVLSWRPSAYAIVIKDGMLLVSPQYNGYDLPGGGLDLGEKPEEAVVREAKEETGIDVGGPVLADARSNFFKLPHLDEDKYIQSLMFYYRCDFVGGTLSMDGFDEYEKEYARMPEWLPLEKLDQIVVANSLDWRPIVRKVLLMQASAANAAEGTVENTAESAGAV